MAKPTKAVQEIKQLLQPVDLASWVATRYQEWYSAKQAWLELTKELRDYLFATDTTTTTNRQLPWKNKTSIPKLTQLRDNLHANYMAALFPHDNWFKWQGDNADAALRKNALLIESYMRQKIKESRFKDVISKMLYDYIDYGNAIGEVSYQTDQTVTPDGQPVTAYSGPRADRLSPVDLQFDLSAGDFYDAAKITRRIVSMGSLKRAHEMDPEGFSWVPEALADTLRVRSDMSGYKDSDIDKSQGTVHDGFGDLARYYASHMVELLEYEGDFFNQNTSELQTNRKIIVMDRRVVVYNEAQTSWLGRSNKEHVAWRDRPDNLMGMGPLDNLVGMQYRIDHLENLKADVFDQIAHPMLKIKGIVEDFEWEPGGRAFMDHDADVQEMRPDATALNADFQIERLMMNMEELAGAPRQAMGVRTPGEKTAFEVQALENAAGRIFQQKIQKFEEQLVEPMLNQMLEAARRNFDAAEMVRVLDDDLGAERFKAITKDVLAKRGKLYPIGARHFAKQAQLVQNLNGFVSSAAYADPLVAAHVSAKKIAKLYEENLGLSEFELVQDNIRVAEQQQTQNVNAQAQEQLVKGIAERQSDDDIAAEEE
jgi:hypothetical protein